MLELFVDSIKYFFAGMVVGFKALFDGLLAYMQISSIKDEVVAAILGVPVVLVSLAGILSVVSKVLKKILKN